MPYVSLPHVLTQGPEDEAVEALAGALSQLMRAGACCGPDDPAGPAAPPGPTVTAAPRRRGRHTTRPRSRRFVLPGVTVVDPAAGSRETADLLVADGKIAAILPPRSGPHPGYDVLEVYRGCVVTPALVDMHVHLPPDSPLALTGLFLSLFLAHGVTTVRDAGDLDGTSLAAARGGSFLGPRIFAAGSFVTKGRARWKNSLFVAGPEDAGRIARTLVGQGAQCMKLYENLAADEIAALEAAAAQHGLLTLGHVPTRLGFEEAPLADAQHFFGVPPPASLPRDHVLDRTSFWDAVDERRMDVVVRAAVEGRRANTPTLVVGERLLAAGDAGRLDDDPALRLLPRFFRDVIWHPRRGLPPYRGPSAQRTGRLRTALDRKLVLVEKLHRAGAPLRLGTDFQPFVVPGAALHAEMRLFARAGIPTADVLRMATRDAALALGRDDLGTVRRGATADLLVCTGDPSRDLGALDSIRAVVHGGALIAAENVWHEIHVDLAAREEVFARLAAGVLARLSMWRAVRNYVA